MLRAIFILILYFVSLIAATDKILNHILATDHFIFNAKRFRPFSGSLQSKNFTCLHFED